MELKEFVKTAVLELISAVEEVERESGREVHLSFSQDGKCVMFDIAVTAENTSTGNVEGGIKVWGFNLGGESTNEIKSSNVSRISFGVYVNSSNKKEEAQRREKYEKRPL